MSLISKIKSLHSTLLQQSCYKRDKPLKAFWMKMSVTPGMEVVYLVPFQIKPIICFIIAEQGYILYLPVVWFHWQVHTTGIQNSFNWFAVAGDQRGEYHTNAQDYQERQDYSNIRHLSLSYLSDLVWIQTNFLSQFLLDYIISYSIDAVFVSKWPLKLTLWLFPCSFR